MGDRAPSEKVTDEAMPPATFFDCGMVHLLTAATLKRLGEYYPDGKIRIAALSAKYFPRLAGRGICREFVGWPDSRDRRGSPAVDYPEDRPLRNYYAAPGKPAKGPRDPALRRAIQ